MAVLATTSLIVFAPCVTNFVISMQNGGSSQGRHAISHILRLAFPGRNSGSLAGGVVACFIRGEPEGIERAVRQVAPIEESPLWIIGFYRINGLHFEAAVTADPNRHQRIIIRASSGGFRKPLRSESGSPGAARPVQIKSDVSADTATIRVRALGAGIGTVEHTRPHTIGCAPAANGSSVIESG